jgi:chromosomal replication initiation ATPase DnaA
MPGLEMGLGGAPVVTLPGLLRDVAAAFETTVPALLDRRQPKLLGPARQAFILLAVRLTANSYRVIGEAIHRDHSTVMTAETIARERERIDPVYAERLRRLNPTGRV